jgi:hypothetical protein
VPNEAATGLEQALLQARQEPTLDAGLGQGRGDGLLGPEEAAPFTRLLMPTTRFQFFLRGSSAGLTYSMPPGPMK